MSFSFRPAVSADVDRVTALKKIVMRDDLVRVLGSWDDARSRARVEAHFSPENTRVISVDGEDVGTVTMRPEGDVVWLEMFYLSPAVQGRGLGTAVLRTLLAEYAHTAIRLEVLAGARVRAFYEREGFGFVSTDGIDDVLERTPA